MLYWVFSGIGLLCFALALLLRLFACTKHLLLQGIMFVIGLSLTILFTPTAMIVAVEAKKNYSDMLHQKEFIENNYTCSDILTKLQIHQEYYQYQFKLERMKESKELGMFSIYYNYDIDALELMID